MGSQWRAFVSLLASYSKRSVISKYVSTVVFTHRISSHLPKFYSSICFAQLQILRYALPSSSCCDRLALLMQHASHLATSDVTPTRRSHRLPKRDVGSQCVLLGSDSSKQWHGELAKLMEQNNNHLRAW